MHHGLIRNPGILASFLSALVTLLSISTTNAGAAELQQNVARGSAADAKIFYVSTAGNDSWSGTLREANSSHSDGPLASLKGARNAVRRLKAQGALTTPVTVYIRQGRYQLTEPVIFGPEDSGQEGLPITYAAFPGETPVISGGQAITGWKKSKRGGSHNLFEAKVPATKDGAWYFRQLFVNGQRRQRARTPTNGFFYVDGDLSDDKYARFRYHDDNILLSWPDRKDVEVVILQAWTVMRDLITSVDAKTRTVTLSDREVGQGGENGWGREKNARYWIENTFEALDSPGEWYLDHGTSTLYYWPIPGEDMNRVQVVAPTTKELVRFEGGVWGDEEPGQSGWPLYPVHDIHLVGLTFEHTDWFRPAQGYTDKQGSFDVGAAIEAVGADSITIEKSTFQRLGEYAVEFGKGCHANRIVRNEMSDIGAGGVKIGEPKVPNSVFETTSGNLVSDNRIHDIGNVYPGTVAIWVGQSGSNTIAHNEIYNTYQTGIAVGWTWDFLPTAATDNIVEFNNIHDIGRGILGDMGCIYTVGVIGGVIRNNLCHDVSRFEGTYGGWGIYPDQGSVGLLIENNVVYRAEDGAIHQNIANQNIFRNNIFALGKRAQLARQVHTDRKDRDWITLEHNIICWKTGKLLDEEWDDKNLTFDSNLYFNPDPQQIRFGNLSFADWQKRGLDTHSIVADPLFVDPDHGNFTLQPGSPALQIGFKPIDLSGVGPTPER
jgi:hypothetical protein